MKNIKLIIAAVVLLFTGLTAQIDRSKIPGPGPAPEINIGEYKSFTLPNGLKVFVVENDKIPRVTFSLEFVYNEFLEGASAGYGEIAGDLVGRGTKKRSKQQLDEEVDFIGANLITSKNRIYGSALSKHTEKFVEILADVAINADFNSEELEKVRKQTLSALAFSKNDPNTIANNVRNALVYGLDHPYGEQVTEETVKNINLEDCRKYYETFFRPNIAYLAIVGDIDFDDAEKLINKYFSSWVQGDIPKDEIKEPKQPIVRKVAIVDRPDAVQSVIHVAYPVKLEIGNPDVIKTSVLNTLLGGSFSSRLNQNLREAKAFTYGARSSLTSDRYIGKFDASCEARNSVTDSAVTEFLNEMKRIRNEKITEEELQSTINFQTGSFSRSLESPETIANFALNIAKYNLPRDYYKNYLKNLSAVTVDDVNAMAKKYIKPDNAYVLVIGNAAEVAENLKKFSVGGKIDYYDNHGSKVDLAAKKLPEGLTAQNVIDKYIQALGGKENILKIKEKTTRMKGSVQGFEIKLVMHQKAPNKFSQELDAGVMKQKMVFDGEKGKSSGMGMEQNLEGEELEIMKLQANMYSFLNYCDLGITPELTGVEIVNGKDAYKINLVMTSGKKSSAFFDISTGLKIREVQNIKTPQGAMDQIIDYDNYQLVEGVMHPFSVSQQIGPMTIPLEVTSVEINKGLDDSLFEVK